MKRISRIGALSGLFGLCLATGAVVAQLPPLPADPVPLPMPAQPGDDAPILDLPPAVPVPEPNPVYRPEPQGVYQPDPQPQFHSQVAPYQSGSPQPPGYYGDTVVPGVNNGPTAWQPGGYEPRNGRPYYYTTPGRNQPLYTVHGYSRTPWAIDHSAYQYHFGPGYYRHSEGGHYRFPYYTYRAPWYFPGHPIYNRDTNRPW
jgi:hypothetical protein